MAHTWHVHHPAVAALEHSFLLTAQAAGRHAVGRVALKLWVPEVTLSPAVAPGLWQVGQLQEVEDNEVPWSWGRASR